MPYSTFIESAWNDLQKIRKLKPLVHNITNSVVTNFTANCLLAVGASPLMAHAQEELEEIVTLSRALVINIGTLDQFQIEAMKTAIEFANTRKIPIVIDPVGAGATSLRTEAARSLLSTAKNAILRGNSSEILAIAQISSSNQGVDSGDPSRKGAKVSQELIHQFQASCIVVSGKEDYITDSQSQSRHLNGHEIMTQVTGTGCSLSAIIAAFASVNPNQPAGVRHAVSFYGVAGEIAAKKSHGPGTFKIHFLDTLHNMTQEELSHHVRVELC